MASDGSSSLDNSLELCEKKPFVMLIDSIEVNMIIEAKDKYENWFISKVVAVDKELKKVKVHFAGWGSRFDEWIDIDKQRLREAGPNATERYHRKRDKPLKVGDRVQTKWEDNRSYLGRIVSIREDQADILFDDGVQVTRPLSSVRRRLQDRVLNKSLEDTVKQEASLQALAEARRRRARKRRNDDDSVTTDDYSSPPSSPLPERRRRKSIPLALLSDDEMETDKLDETSKKLTKDKECVAMATKTSMESQTVSVKKEYKEEPRPSYVDNPPIDTTCSPAVQQSIADMETEGVSLKDTVHIKPDPDSQKSPAKVRKRRAPKMTSSEGGGTPRKQSNRLKLKKDVHTVKSDKEKPVHLAPKEYVVVLDHNKFKCHFTDCKKSFRKDILLNAHLKHYHNIQVEEKQPTNDSSNPKPKGLPGRPSKSTSSGSKKSSELQSKKSSELQSKKDSSLEHKPSKISPKQKGTTNEEERVVGLEESDSGIHSRGSLTSPKKSKSDSLLSKSKAVVSSRGKALVEEIKHASKLKDRFNEPKEEFLREMDKLFTDVQLHLTELSGSTTINHQEADALVEEVIALRNHWGTNLLPNSVYNAFIRERIHITVNNTRYHIDCAQFFEPVPYYDTPVPTLGELMKLYRFSVYESNRNEVVLRYYLERSNLIELYHVLCYSCDNDRGQVIRGQVFPYGLHCPSYWVLREDMVRDVCTRLEQININM